VTHCCIESGDQLPFGGGGMFVLLCVCKQGQGKEGGALVLLAALLWGPSDFVQHLFSICSLAFALGQVPLAQQVDMQTGVTAAAGGVGPRMTIGEHLMVPLLACSVRTVCVGFHVSVGSLWGGGGQYISILAAVRRAGYFCL
jgi:hypothetical protein